MKISTSKNQKNMSKTPDEIKAMIKKLQEQKKNVPPFSLFDDPNHRIIDTQMDILEGTISDEDELWDKQDELEFTDEHISTARTAFEWMEGEITDEEFLGEE